MMTPIFLNNPQNTVQYFNLNHDPHHHHGQDQPPLQLPIPPFCPSVVSSATTLHLDQSQPFSDQHQGSKKNGIFDDQVNHDPFIFKRQEDEDLINNPNNTNKGSSLRWMSSKMRMMRKMINNSNGPKADHPRLGSRVTPPSSNKLENNNPQLVGTNNNNNNVIRTCSDCNTTRTPLWRSGPQGPKTLCNACGIRQRKARKAAMEAAAAATAALNSSSTEASSSTLTKTTIKLLANKDKKKSRVSNNTTCVSQHNNKRQANNQLAAADSDPKNSSTTSSRSGKQQLRFEEFAVNLLRENAAFCRMFPQDEEEGALLLMALSYDLIHS